MKPELSVLARHGLAVDEIPVLKAIAGERLLCRERIAEEWNNEWQARIRSSAIRENATCLVIPKSLYAEALKHRKGR
jgi:hypothetical protein